MTGTLHSDEAANTGDDDVVREVHEEDEECVVSGTVRTDALDEPQGQLLGQRRDRDTASFAEGWKAALRAVRSVRVAKRIGRISPLAHQPWNGDHFSFG
jgi:hypothetical protein